MSRTQISTDGIADDAVTSAKLASQIGIGTDDPQTPLQVITGGASSTLPGAAQTEIFQVIDGTANDFVNLGRFHCNYANSRGSFAVSNSGTDGAWEDNVLQFFVHGSTYLYGYYGGNTSDAGAAMIVTQGTDITKLQIGNYNSAPIEFFTNNTFRLAVAATGEVGIGTAAPSVPLHVVSTGDGVTEIARFRRQNSGNTDGAHLSIHADNTNNVVQIRSTGTSAGSLSFYSGSNERFAMATTGALSAVVPGGSTLYPMYACRAWVNFDGTANSNATGTYSQTGTTVTVTVTNHGFVAGDNVYLDFTSGTATDGTFTVATVPTANTFTVTRTSATTSGNVTVVKNTIRASGNVSSIADNGTGNYTINFTTAMPDASYAALATPTYEVGVTNTVSIVARSFTTTSVLIVVSKGSNVVLDVDTISVAIFR